MRARVHARKYPSENLDKSGNLFIIGTRIKTVELIVEKTVWTPPARKFTDNELVPVRIGFTDSASMEKAKAVQGRWDQEKKLWFIRYGKVKGTDLEKHIVLDAFLNKGKC